MLYIVIALSFVVSFISGVVIPRLLIMKQKRKIKYKLNPDVKDLISSRRIKGVVYKQDSEYIFLPLSRIAEIEETDEYPHSYILTQRKMRIPIKDCYPVFKIYKEV